MGLAINLTEQAFRRLAKRVVVQGLGMSAAAQVLIAADFAIGEEQSQSVDGSNSEGDANVKQTVIAADTDEAEVDRSSVLPSFEDLLTQLGISRHAAILETERIISATDLSLLSRDDCKELGFSIGERNRVADWASRVVSASHRQTARLILKFDVAVSNNGLTEPEASAG